MNWWIVPSHSRWCYLSTVNAVLGKVGLRLVIRLGDRQPTILEVVTQSEWNRRPKKPIGGES